MFGNLLKVEKQFRSDSKHTHEQLRVEVLLLNMFSELTKVARESLYCHIGNPKILLTNFGKAGVAEFNDGIVFLIDSFEFIRRGPFSLERYVCEGLFLNEIER